MSTAAIVLAGGRSRRLGTDKAGVTVAGVTLLRRTLDTLASAGVGAASVVVVGDDAPAPYATVRETQRYAGPLAAVAAGASALPDVDATHVFVLGCDHPFLSPDLLRLLDTHRDTTRSVCVVDADGRVQYLLGVHPRARLARAAALVAAGERSLAAWCASDTDLVAPGRWRTVDPDGLSLLDVDTPEDLAAARARAGLRDR